MLSLCRINPNYTDALIKLASLLSTQEKHEECNALVDRALSLNPINADILHKCASILMSICKYVTDHNIPDNCLSFLVSNFNVTFFDLAFVLKE